jgi:membrane-associated phospholipid phosphatase
VIRPYELAFGGFLLLMIVRLAVGAGIDDPNLMQFAGLAAFSVAVVVGAPPRLRLLYWPIALQAGYFLLGPSMDALHVRKVDGLLQQIDQQLVGVNPSVVFESFAHPVLTDLMSGCYLLFFPYLILSHLDFFRRGDDRTLQRFCDGLYTIYAVGLLGYVLLPAAGPYVAMADQFRAPLEGGLLTRVHHAIVVRGTNGVDVFPSLHCAVTAFLLFFDRRHAPARYRWLLVPVALLWVSTIYLRYHYFVDIVAGFSLAGVGLLMARAPEIPWRGSPVPSSDPATSS